MDASLKIQNKDEQPAQDVNTAFKSVTLVQRHHSFRHLSWKYVP